ncbi:unnamed protein product, partial [marine sediment metagenome]
IVDGGSTVDEVLVRIASRNPDRLDINCHGGAAPHTAIMNLLERLGVRKCRWKELASESARTTGLDAIQIEALERIPGALTLQASKMLIAQHNGALSKFVKSRKLHKHRDELLEYARYGTALCEPPKSVIAGKPNVGKSTLLNCLLRRERVITSPTPGTTRDAVSAFVNVRGVPLELVDTAGLGDARGEIETLAGEKAMDTLSEADLVLCVIDGSEPVTPEDKAILDACADKKKIVVINKSDLPQNASAPQMNAAGAPSVSVSAIQKTGIEELKGKMLET